jgi:uncharacterized caspase-like protein
MFACAMGMSAGASLSADKSNNYLYFRTVDECETIYHKQDWVECKRIVAERIRQKAGQQNTPGDTNEPSISPSPLSTHIPPEGSFGRISDIRRYRVALVIGNGAYPNLGALKNPPNDAKLMAKTLRSLGFDVLERIDANQKGMRKAIKVFGNKLETAGKDAVGLFYYAGHGVQVRGENYMVPVNVDIQDEADVRIEAVSASAVQENMAFAGNDLNIIVMDACRNNPFKRSFRSAARGLAKMDASKGTLIAYATSPGDVAADGKGDNSPYTKALAKAMQTPGMTVERVFKQVRNQVIAVTDSAQVPWEASSLTGGDFYFKHGSNSTTAVPSTTVQPAQQQNLEAMFWQSIQGSDNTSLYQSYLDQYPNGIFAPIARVKVAAVQDPQVAALPSKPIPQANPGLKNGEYEFGLGMSLYVKENYAEAFKSFQDAASKGHAKALHMIAQLYENGWGVGEDMAEALRYHRSAAEKGNIESYGTIGLYYKKGWVVRADYEEAMRWWHKGAALGDWYSIGSLGYAYMTGDAGEVDFKKARFWYEKRGKKVELDRLDRLEAESQN